MSGVLGRTSALLATLLLAAGLIQAQTSITATAADTATWKLRELQSVKQVPVTPVNATPTNTARKQAAPITAATWPAPGTAAVDLPVAPLRTEPIQAGVLPVHVAPGARTKKAAPASGQLQVEILDRKTTAKVGSEGLLIAIRDKAAHDDVRRLQVQVDYSSFGKAYGGDWASRLRLVALPSCALTTPNKAECRKHIPVATVNDTRTDSLTATVDLLATIPADLGASPITTRTSPTATTTLLAATAAPTGGTGKFTATSLTPSGSWTAGGSAGGFTWSYPLAAPAVPGGPAPALSLNYSSQSVDGRTAATNNQANWIGDGWSLEPGYVERRYKACAADMKDGNNATKTGDLCWDNDNAVLSLNGRTTDLVHDDKTGAWKLKADDGSKVEKLTGAANGDSGDSVDGKGEHWKVTTPDGTQYFFGLNQLPQWSSGKAETNSVLAVPVFGNHRGEPCRAAAFADSWCQQAWRWNLDYVVDTHDSAMAYFYNSETNYYGRNVSATTGESTAAQYTRGSYLTRIEYGHRATTLFTAKAPAVVEFNTAERCLADCGAFDKSHAKNWPDVPFDQYCASGTECKDRYAPTFWTRKRLTGITTRVLIGGAYKDVDTWTLAQEFPPPGDGTDPALWLSSITRTGKVGGTASLPAVTFERQQLANRVDGLHDNLAPLIRYRINAIRTESGAVIGVTYSSPDCTPSTLPTEAANTRRCYPVYWTPDDAPEKDPTKDWFHKYVVTQVLETDTTGGAPAKETDYDYLDGAAWAKSEDEFTKASERTYSDFRGYGRVRVRTGADSPQTLTETRYFRGIDGAQVKDSEGNAVTDQPPFAGMNREEATYNGVGGQLLSARTYEPWHSAATASHIRSGLPDQQAYLIGTKAEQTRIAIGSTWRRTALTRHFDSYGAADEISDQGDTAITGDESCTRVTFARNTKANLIDTVASTRVVAVTCDKLPTLPGDLISETRTYYDGSTALGEAPVKGDITRTDKNDGVGTGFNTVGSSGDGTTKGTGYDVYGRITAATDASGQTTRTDYVPATGESPSSTTITNPRGHQTVTTLDPARGQTLTVVDANGKQTDTIYDPLGRLTKVWIPGRPKATYPDSPNTSYTYTVSKTAPSTVATTTLQGDDTFTTSYTFYDSLLRERETQAPAVNGSGRVISETLYGSRGQIWRTYGSYYAKDLPNATLVTGDNTKVADITDLLYDGAGRVTGQIAKKYGDETWRTTTSYDGDRTTVTPPAGGTAVTTVSDAQGRTTQLIQYAGVGRTSPQTTLYSYNKRGLLESVTDPDRNTWTYTYDFRGRQIRIDDPDKGPTATDYDNADRPITTTDSRGNTLTTTYDELGRKRTLKQGNTLLAEWTYDTVKKGQPTASIRYSGGQQYKSEVTTYNNFYEPAATQVTIPAAEGALQGTYKWTYGYNANTGAPEWIANPALGNLAAERVTTTYDTHGMPKATSAGSIVLVNNSTYDAFGRIIRTEYGDFNQHLYASYDYDEQTSQLTRTTTDRTAAPQRIDDTTYTYDPAGNVTRIATASGQDAGKATDTQCFTTDALRRLTNAWTATDNCGAQPTGTNNPKVGGPDPYWTSYTYSPVGSRLSEVQHDAAGDTSKDTTRTYTYPISGSTRSHQLTEVGTTVAGVTTDTDAYAYDPAGNTMSRTTGITPQGLIWDAEGHLAQLTEGSKTSKYLYDVDGNRIIRRDTTGTTLYLPGGTELLLKADGTKSATRYYSHGGQTVAVRTGGKLNYLFTDAHGTDIASVDASTQAITRRKSTIFGAPRGTQPTWPGQKGFVGGTIDIDTGLTHLGAREYDPSIGRFISVDPLMDLSDPQQVEGYTYSNNNPITYSDPSGLMLACGGGNFPSCPHGGAPVGGYGLGDMDPAPGSRESVERAYLNTVMLYESGAKPVRSHANGTSEKEYEAASRKYQTAGARMREDAAMQMWYYGASEEDIDGMRDHYCWYLHCNTPAEALLSGHLVESPFTDQLMSDTVLGGIAAGVGRMGGGARGGVEPQVCNSFLGGTDVLMADGTRKDIDKIEVGDQVLATDPETGRTEPHTVTATIHRPDDTDFVDVTVDVGDIVKPKITATEHHPFWSPNAHAWVDAVDLKPSATLRTDGGKAVTVVYVKRYHSLHAAYNLTVEGLHTYYVLAGETPVLVHNSNCDFKIGVADEKYDKHVLGLDDSGNPTRRPDMPEYDTDDGFERYVADAQALMCPGSCPAAAREAVRSDGVIIRMDSQGRIGMRDGNTITTYFRPDDPLAYFQREAAR
ncbi:polymorphic toxin-type HINT domain-containing protein [Peterkaempfera bronchialis]|uniref:polymorphic toxin-type HINT domain-containing protein n=1 Tax=Peterkaempfera bronchialis TaxID=2126346 RepID=UPI003C30204D